MTHGDFIRQLRWRAIGVMQHRVSQAGTLVDRWLSMLWILQYLIHMDAGF